MKTTITVLFFLILGFGASAQQSLSLDECISYAVSHNLTLNDLRYAQKSGQETYRQSIRNLFPTINGSTDYNIQYGRGTDPNTNDIVNTDFFSNNYSLNASLDLFQGFQKVNTIKATKFLYHAAMEDTQQEKYMLAFRVMSAYYDIKFYEGLVANSKEQVQLSENNNTLVNKQIELGLKAKADLYESEANLLGDQLLLAQNVNKLNAAKLQLLQEMNWEGPSDVVFEDDISLISDFPQTLDTDSIYGQAKTIVPSIKAQELRVKAAKKDVAVARGKLAPSLGLFSGYGTGYYETNINDDGDVIPFSTQINDNASHYIGVQMNIPISNGWAGHSNVKQRKISLDRANNTLQVQEQELFKLIQQLVQEHDATLTELAQSDKKVEAQEQAFAVAQKKYEKGLISALDLFQAKNLYGTAQNENLQVRSRLLVNEKTLEFYRGLPVLNIN